MKSLSIFSLIDICDNLFIFNSFLKKFDEEKHDVYLLPLIKIIEKKYIIIYIIFKKENQYYNLK